MNELVVTQDENIKKMIITSMNILYYSRDLFRHKGKKKSTL